MNDMEIDFVQRAIDNGWKKVENATSWPGSPGYPWTGWLVSEGHGIPVLSGREREEWVGSGKDRHKVTYIDSWDRLPRERLNHNDFCGECGRRVEYGGFVGYEIERAPLPYCWLCNFWVERISDMNERQFVVESDGRRSFYSIGTATTPSSYNGFGGNWFSIEFLDGRAPVKTCDMWCGGDVPERFYDRLPVTARFVLPEGHSVPR